MVDFEVKHGQLDALWTYIGNRGKKGLPRDREKKKSSGVQPIWIPTAAYGALVSS